MAINKDSLRRINRMKIAKKMAHKELFNQIKGKNPS